MAQAARGSRAALPSLLVLSGIWAVLHGATFVFIPLTFILADIIHFGSLLFGLWAAYATWRVLRAGPGTVSSDPGVPTARDAKTMGLVDDR
jgi:hypothetical protein